MKNKYYQIVLGTICVLLSIGFIQSCQNLEDIADDVTLVLDTDLLYHPLMIQYVNADLESGEVPEDLEIEILGPGKDKVYSLFASRQIHPDGNFVNIGVRKIESPSVDNPIEITVVAKAPGYLTSHRTFVIHDTDLQFTTIPMVKVGQNAPGISSESIGFFTNTSGATETTSFSTPLAFGKKEKAEVTVLAGTKLYNKNGQELKGEVQVSLTHFDNRSDIARKAMTGNPTASKNVIDVDGTNLGHGGLIPLGAISLQMTVNGKEVKTFSQPLDVRFTLNPDAMHPETNQPIRPGDELVVGTYDEATGDLVFESRENITVNAQGQLELKYQQSHLSTWFVGSPVPPGCFFFQALVQSPIPSFSTVQRFFYVELRDVGTNALISTNFLQLKNNEIITFFFVPNAVARVDVYDGNDICPAHLIAQSDPLNLCALIGFINLNDDPLFVVDEIIDAFVEISGICDEIVPILTVQPTLVILYQDNSECNIGGLNPVNNFAPLGQLVGGQGQTTKLRVGQRYDFGIMQGGIERVIRDIPVPQNDSTFNINYVDVSSGGGFVFNQVINVVYEPGDGGVGRKVRFEFLDIDIPDCACEIWRCHQNGGTPAVCDPMVNNPANHPCGQ